MLPENNIKEQISLKFIETIANYNGYKTEISKNDFGTDLTIAEVGIRNENNKQRIYDTGRELKIQLKSSLGKNLTITNDFVKFDLESKTYNDLIVRKDSNKTLLLILFILPNN